ncbi:hypothetical protein [Enterococcus sp. DIV0187]
MFWIIVAFMIGTFFGVIIMAILSAGKYDDMVNNRIEWERMD